MIKEKILIVDDEVDSMEALKDVLEDRAYQVDTANSGQKAIEAIQKKVFDIILMDIKMPIINGVETYMHIKEKCREKRTTVIMMTAYTVDELIQEAVKGGAYAVIKKPFDIDHVLDLIRQSKEVALILIIEDDPSVAESLRDVLQENGLCVTVVGSGEEAVEHVRRNPQNILLIDMKLPGMNGLETYLKIKAINPNPIAIMMTAYREEAADLVKEAVKSGAHTCVYKPIDPARLLQLIKGIVEKKRAGEPSEKPE